MDREEDFGEVLGEAILRRYNEWTLFARAEANPGAAIQEFLAWRFDLLWQIQSRWGTSRSAAGDPLAWGTARPDRRRLSGNHVVVAPDRQAPVTAEPAWSNQTPRESASDSQMGVTRKETPVETPVLVRHDSPTRPTPENRQNPVLVHQPAASNERGHIEIPRETEIHETTSLPVVSQGRANSTALPSREPEVQTPPKVHPVVQIVVETGNPAEAMPVASGATPAARRAQSTATVQQERPAASFAPAAEPSPPAVDSESLPYTAGPPPMIEITIRETGRRRLAALSEVVHQTTARANTVPTPLAPRTSPAQGPVPRAELPPSGSTAPDMGVDSRLTYVVESQPSPTTHSPSSLPHVQPNGPAELRRTNGGSHSIAMGQTPLAPGGSTAGATTESAAGHPAVPPPASERPLDIDEVAERAVELLTRRLSIEAERRGVTQWR